MATIQQLKTQIENANALGRTNLSEKGVELPAGATTYNIMTAIAEIVSGGGSGTEYTNIVYNTDNTVTLTDKAGVIHTMSCTYEDGKLVAVSYDGKSVKLTYDGDVLVNVGGTDIKLNSTEPSKLQVYNPIATTELTGYEAAKAFDGNVATRWATTAYQHRGGIGAEFEIPCKIAYAKCIKSEYDWKNLTLQCSDDGINWVKASEEIAEPIYDIHGSTTIQSIESGLHKWWRVYSSSCETVAEIEFYGFAVSKQYQNGFALGMASGGVVNEKILDHTVTFTVDGEPYEIVSVKNGNSVNKPNNTIEKDGFICNTWQNSNEELISFPYEPKEDVILFGVWLPNFDGLFLLNGDSLPVVESVSDLKPSVNKVTDIADGKFNSAIVLGSRKWLKYVSNIFAVGTNDYTLECWAKPNNTSAGDGKLFAWYNGSNGDGFFTLKTNTIIWAEKSALSADIDIDDGQFHHIAFVRHNQVDYIYVDGIKVASMNRAANLTHNVLYIGVNGAFDGYESEFFDGLVDDIAFFDYAKYTENFTPRTKPYAVV